MEQRTEFELEVDWCEASIRISLGRGRERTTRTLFLLKLDYSPGDKSEAGLSQL